MQNLKLKLRHYFSGPNQFHLNQELKIKYLVKDTIYNLVNEK